MTEAQIRFVELEKRKEAIKKYFEELQAATEAVAKECGIGSYFQDNEGTVYKIVVPEGRFVKYEQIGYQRTRRADEKRGDLSLTEAREAGFDVK